MTTSALWLAEPFIDNTVTTEFVNVGTLVGSAISLGPGDNIILNQVSFNPLVISMMIQDDLLNEDLGDIKALEIRCVTDDGSSSVDYRKLLV